MPSFTRESGGTLHVVGVGVNRIGKHQKTTRPIIVDITHSPLHGDEPIITPIRRGDDGAIGAQRARLEAAFASAEPGVHRYLLVLRFAVINLVAFALLGGAYVQGWIHMVIGADSTGLTFAIFAAFAVGLAICGAKVWRASAEINWAKAQNPRPGTRAARYLAEVRGRGADSRAILASALRLKLFSRIAVVRQIASTLVVLGLIGTVIGFIIALSGVRPEAAGDASAIGPMVSTLIVGMSVALFTTLVGAVFNVWLMVAHQILATGTVNMFTAIVEAGERDAVS